jgi:RNA polymerase sigma-70 factor, ECF subfamily
MFGALTMDTISKQTSYVELLTASQQPLYAYINTLLWGDANVRDVLQETNLELWQKADTYDSSKPFLPWAYGFAYYRVLAYRKAQSNSKLVFSDELLKLADETIRSQAEFADERLVALSKCLQNLRPSQRELVRLRYEEAQAAADIARGMGATEMQIGSRLYRIRKLLSECIARRVRQTSQ